MRVAFVIWPAPAHIYPQVPLAWALRTAGHEVSIISHPCIGQTVTASGLPFMPFCDEREMAPPAGPGGAWTEERAELNAITESLKIPPKDFPIWSAFIHAFVPSSWDFTPYRGSPGDPLPAMDGLVTFFRQWRPDLVVWDPCLPGAAVAARVCGARHARFQAPDFNGWCLDTFTRLTTGPDAPRLDNPLAETVRAMAERYGVPVDHETLYGQRTFEAVPAGMALPVDTEKIPIRVVAHAAQAPMPDWLYPVPQRPRVALTLGASVRAFLSVDWGYVAVLLEALSGLDVEVVATLNDAQLTSVPKIPDNVRIVEWVPLDYLAPTCSAMIHHGGIGTMASAAQACIPQLVVDFPQREFSDRDFILKGSEQIGKLRYVLGPLTGEYVTRFGAGEVLDMGEPSVETIREQVTRVLTDPSVKDGAARVRDDLLMTPSPSEVVGRLERVHFASA